MANIVVVEPSRLKPEHAAAIVANDQWTHARNTKRAYRAALDDFRAWIGGHQYGVDAGSVSAYILAMDAAGAATSTIRARLAAIASVYPDARRNPIVERQMKAIVRRRAAGESTRTNQSTAKTAFALAEVKAIVAAGQPVTLADIRDRAIVLLGYWGGFRRSELVALNWSDLSISDRGVIVMVRKSKTDQAGEGMRKPIAAQRNRDLCPVVALLHWRDAAGMTDGPVFVGTVSGSDKVTSKRLTEQVVRIVVRRVAKRAGLTGDFGAHSLRSGIVTTLRKKGVNDRHTKAITGHKTDKMLDRYDQSPLDDAMDAVAEAMKDE